MTVYPRVLGIDYGRKRIGIAVTDPLGLMAHPVATLQNTGDDQTIAEIKKICDEKEVARIVLGLPVNMDGSKGPMALEVEDFARRLAIACRRTVETFDERLTSWEAESRLAQSGMKWREMKKRVDQVAAVLILQSWVERGGLDRTLEPPGAGPEKGEPPRGGEIRRLGEGLPDLS
jgi:putative Holliday junction resolvase